MFSKRPCMEPRAVRQRCHIGSEGHDRRAQETLAYKAISLRAWHGAPGHDRNEVYHVPRGTAYEAVASLVRVHCERGIGVFMGREQAACDAQVPARFQLQAESLGRCLRDRSWS